MTTRGTITLALPFADYLARESVHFSALKHVDVSSLHYLHAIRGEGRADTDALRFGRAMHALTLTPDVPGVVIWRGGARRGKAWAEFQQEHAGDTILTESESAAAFAMQSAVMRKPRARSLLVGGDAEVTAEWVDPRTSLACRCRFDYLRPGGIVELKTTRSSHPRTFPREFARLMYHAQLAFYADGYEACTGEPPASVHVIAVEKSPPHDVCVYEIGPEVLDAGRRKVDEWFRVVAECTRSGRWPGAGGDVAMPLVLPDWAMTDGLADVDLDGVADENEV